MTGQICRTLSHWCKFVNGFFHRQSFEKKIKIRLIIWLLFSNVVIYTCFRRPGIPVEYLLWTLSNWTLTLTRHYMTGQICGTLSHRFKFVNGFFRRQSFEKKIKIRLIIWLLFSNVVIYSCFRRPGIFLEYLLWTLPNSTPP